MPIFNLFLTSLRIQSLWRAYLLTHILKLFTYVGNVGHVLLHWSEHRHFVVWTIKLSVVHKVGACHGANFHLSASYLVLIGDYIWGFGVDLVIPLFLELVLIHVTHMVLSIHVREPDLVEICLLPNVLWVPLPFLVAHLLVCKRHVVLGELTSCEVGLVHLHRMHWHLKHGSTAIRRSSCVREASNKGLVHHVHLHSHSLQVHLLERIHLLLPNVVYRYLALSATLLRSHWKMVLLVHRELVLALLEVRGSFLDWVLNNFVHLHLVSNAWRRLRILEVMNVEWLVLLHVVLASSGSCAAWVWVDTSHSLGSYTFSGVLLSTTSVRTSNCSLYELIARLKICHSFFLTNVNSASLLIWITILERALCVDTGQERVLNVSLSRPCSSCISGDVDAIVIIDLAETLVVLPLFHYVWVHLVWPTLRNVVLIVLLRPANVLLQRVLSVHHSTVLRLHNILLRLLAFKIAILVLRTLGLVLIEGLVVGITSSLRFHPSLASLTETVLVVFAKVFWTEVGDLGCLLFVSQLRRKNSLVSLNDLGSRLLHQRVVDINTFVLVLVVRVSAFAPQVVKVLVVQGLSGVDSLIRIHFKQLFHQV